MPDEQPPLFESELQGPDATPAPVGDDFDALAGAAIRRSWVGLSDFFESRRGVERHAIARLQLELAEYMRKVYRWGQTGVHPREQP